MYIGTDDGLHAVDEKMNPVENALTEHIGSTRVRCIKKDLDGNLWVCTYKDNKGLVCYTSGGEVVSYTTDNGMPDNQVRCVIPGEDGRIIAGTNNGLAIIKNGKIIQTNPQSDIIANPVFLTVAEGFDGEIFCGSDGDGIYVINGSDVLLCSTVKWAFLDVNTGSLAFRENKSYKVASLVTLHEYVE